MKKFLVGLLVLGSLGAYADNVIYNAKSLDKMTTMCENGKNCEIWYNLEISAKKKKDTRKFHIIFKTLDMNAQMMLKALESGSRKGKMLQIDINSNKYFNNQDPSISSPLYVNEIQNIHVIEK